MIEYHLKCNHCGIDFISAGARGKFCSKECNYWFYVEMSPRDDCWKWHGPSNKMGYGYMSFPKTSNPTILFAHRASWIYHFGSVPEGLGVLHHCDNPPCTNPDHLFCGDQALNSADRDAKGRRIPLFGEGHGMAIITEENVREIKLAISSGIRPIRMEEKFHLCSGYATRIAQGKVWKHVS